MYSQVDDLEQICLTYKLISLYEELKYWSLCFMLSHWYDLSHEIHRNQE